MPVSLAAIFGAAIYQERSSVADPADLDRTASLLARAAGNAGVTFEVHGDELRINGTPLSLEAPGAAVIRHALIDHHTARLMLPRAITSMQWRTVVELFASAPGLYPTVDDLRDALRFTVADAVVSGTSGAAAEGDLRQSLFELPGLRAAAPLRDATHLGETSDAGHADLVGRLDPLLRAAAQAKTKQDYYALAQALWRIHELASERDGEYRAIVERERRRVVSADVLESMARMIPKRDTLAIVGQVLSVLGHDGAAALLNALNGASTPQERRAYIDALVACRDCDQTILGALGSARSELVRDAAEVVGRKRMDIAVPILARLLRHSKVDVRTTAWHALELIGTRDAQKALQA